LLSAESTSSGIGLAPIQYALTVADRRAKRKQSSIDES
jgi:hypothetical protein